MKLWGIFRFELIYQLRRVWPWVFFVVLLVLSFLMARDTSLADAMYEDFFANASFAVAKTTVIGGLIWLLLAAPVAGEAGARDVATGMYPLVYAAPIRKVEYLGGRFLGALAINALLLLAVQAGILLGVYSPGVDPKVIGPFRPAVFVGAYTFIALPNAVVATAVQFALALRSGRAMASYVGSVLLVFMGFFVAALLLFKRGLGTLLDPIGIRFIVEDLSHQWTAIERSTRLLTLEGALLGNRLVWLAIAAGILAATFLRFRFAHRVEGAGRRRVRQDAIAQDSVPSGPTIARRATISVPQMPRAFGLGFHTRQMLAVAGDSLRAITTSWPGLGVLFGVPLVTVLVVLDQMGSMGTPLVPTTARVLRELVGGLSAELAAEPSRWVIVPLFIVFFAGELVWRERDAQLSEITDALPGSDWAPLLGKLVGLALFVVLFLALLMVAGIVGQTIIGYRKFELGLYIRVLFGLQLPEYLLFAVLALLVHVAIGQKYLGHVVAVLTYAFIAVLARMVGIEHHLLVYDTGPNWSYTEMRGFASSVGPWAWFKLYWAAWAVLLAALARLFWIRGREGDLGIRLRSARHRFTPATARTTAAAGMVTLTLGAFIFYNTNVLNEYRSTSATEELRAEYERRYRRYEHLAQPELTRAKLRVELHPTRRAAEIRGSYVLVNRTTVRIDSIHIATAAAGGVDTRALRFDRPATLTVDDEERGYRIYALQTPLAPNDTLRLDFDVGVERHGFSNAGRDPALVANGSYVAGEAWLPFVGYQRFRELLSPAERRAHGLAPRPVLASLYETEGGEPAQREGVAFEAVVATDEDQVAVAPGALRRTWTEKGRRYFEYATDAPIGKEWAFFSARYAVQQEQWNDVAIRIFHHPDHTGHLERMMRSARASLDYYTKQFGPYPYHHLTFVEHPAAMGTGAHSDPSIISYGQGIPFWIPNDEVRSLDFGYMVVAHEMAHQWTPSYALVEGLPFLSEGLATYSALQVVRASRGDEQLRRVLAFMRQPYPFQPIRRGEPVLRALDRYLAYRKGPFAMYALSEYVGSERVNGAIRRMLEKHGSEGATPATTLDLYRELRAVTPDSLTYLLHDLFEVNAFWELETQRARASEAPDGSWRTTLDVRARKVVYDSAGVATEVAMDEWVPLGVFGAADAGHDRLSAPLYVRMHRVRSGKQTITVTVPRKPVLAGIDPYRLLDWDDRGVTTITDGVVTNP